MSESRSVRAPVYAGLFPVTLARMMDEILLTRIFSVTLWYPFAFMAISIAMFGMTVGALIVYLHPRRSTAERPRPLWPPARWPSSPRFAGSGRTAPASEPRGLRGRTR